MLSMCTPLPFENEAVSPACAAIIRIDRPSNDVSRKPVLPVALSLNDQGSRAKMARTRTTEICTVLCVWPNQCFRFRGTFHILGHTYDPAGGCRTPIVGANTLNTTINTKHILRAYLTCRILFMHGLLIPRLCLLPIRVSVVGQSHQFQLLFEIFCISSLLETRPKHFRLRPGSHIPRHTDNLQKTPDFPN